MDIIPAIDILGGRCVRLTQGDYGRKKEYSSDPVEVARTFEQAGAKRLHLVDLDGARSAAPQNLDVLRSIVSATSLVVEFGGGIKSEASLEAVLEAAVEGRGRLVGPALAIGLHLDHAQAVDHQFLVDFCRRAGQGLTLNRREGYDHSYFFIASFIGEHIAWHAARL